MSSAMRALWWAIRTPAHSREGGNPSWLAAMQGRIQLGFPPSREGAEDASEIALLLLLLHRRRLVVVDDAALALAGGGEQHLLDDLGQGRRRALDRAGQRIAALGAEADRAHLWDLALAQPHPLVIDHDQIAVALHHRPF